MTAKTLIKSLPKAELHIHIEGSLEPELLFKLAARNDIELPYDSVESLKATYDFNNLQEFLDIYYQGVNVLQTEQDFFDLCWAYLQRAKQDNVVHVEIFFDPQSHTDRGVLFETVINGLYGACSQAEKELGISFKIIPNFLRHLSEEAALQTYDEAIKHSDKICGFGLDSSELGHPPEKFARVFAKAKQAGFKIVAHAGEEGPPEYIYQAINTLKVDRIDHGNRSLEDPELVKLIVAKQIPLTVCPLSNLKLKVVKDLQEHPIKTMLDNNMLANINSDDPAYFGGYLNENFIRLHEAVNLSEQQIIKLAQNSIIASFLTEPEKSNLLDKIDQTVQNFSA
ncbi:MAG: adenosine deaminase [Proteobacteria bacterium]|nr:adenosine deaminase [Pseudomonadota bacterium]